ncbi:glycosyltransferase family 2 protein [Pontivivens insulae]|uniref:Beta-monoglucosyldiacylglycerol synthase n=1 Tax=Pontivivens insulae TaxID=1639689 RepID=A0A2R8ABC1_9RHOB|nr:glycosyltransferase family 2 protein [Pontivivens insulae]RED11283.1 cellulose synthase/poly-beta-1,6-N-acetylglucosamine synthase-like glycosyltransferase [Pontivivens insulae]SPF29544.1 Beta-monoglucosyldiacylglycerol synthase [Pontivivens insulae]
MSEQKPINWMGAPRLVEPAQARLPSTDPIWTGIAQQFVTAEVGAHAISTARRYGGTPLEVLSAQGAVTPEKTTALLSAHHQIARVDLEKRPPNPDLAAAYRAEDCLRLGFVPWQHLGQTRILAVADPSDFTKIEALTPRLTGPNEVFVLAPRAQIEQAVIDLYEGPMAGRAETLCPDQDSCRGWNAQRFALRAATCLTLLMLLAVLNPGLVLGTLIIWVLLANSLTMALRLVSLALLPRARRQERLATLGHQLPRRLPIVTILLPVLREVSVLDTLIASMRALNYPDHRLDFLILVEEGDQTMRDALATRHLPHNMRMLVVPAARLRTKPRAMNYALPFCRGEIIGIYDAEDRPDPEQIRRVVAQLNVSSPRVACVQAHLDFYNPNQNWLTRCFTLEYATWFRVLLHGAQALRFPLPLGGTSVFFRADILRRLGGWDAHNVTEDADLGMRLARKGFRCEMVRSTTYEEANPAMGNWLRQRSRWLKGYAITWATHMRRPRALWQELGPRGFLGFQVLFLGALTAYLAIPLLWVLVAGNLLGVSLPQGVSVPPLLLGALWVSLPLGQCVMLLTVIQAQRSRGDFKLMPWVFTLPLYWPLGAVAAWRAVAELCFAPFHWHKTTHGLSKEGRGHDR